MFYVYVLVSDIKGLRFYVGMTSNVEQKTDGHNDDKTKPILQENSQEKSIKFDCDLNLSAIIKFTTHMKTTLFLKIACFSILSLLHLKIQANDTVKVFYNYRAYQDNYPNQTFPKLQGYNALGRGMSIDVIKNGKQEKIACAEIWGFLYKGFLFRTEKRTGQVAMLISKGKICYYENGAANIEMLKTGIKQAVTWLGYQCYFSEDLDSEMAPTPTPGTLSDAQKLIKRFWKQHPQYELLKDFIDKNYDYRNVRDQVNKFEKNKLF